MDTLLIIKDTIAVNFANAIDLSKQCPQEIPTNEYDFGIVFCICVLVFLVAIVVKSGFKAWQKAKFNYLKELDNQRNLHESTRIEKEYQREKERAVWDNSKKDRDVSEALKLICDASKDKDGKIDKDILIQLLTSFNTARGYRSQSGKGENV